MDSCQLRERIGGQTAGCFQYRALYEEMAAPKDRRLKNALRKCYWLQVNCHRCKDPISMAATSRQELLPFMERCPICKSKKVDGATICEGMTTLELPRVLRRGALISLAGRFNFMPDAKRLANRKLKKNTMGRMK